jgi:hypothetical protein
MSAMGHQQTSRPVRAMSVSPLKADIHQRGLHVRFVPKADSRRDAERMICCTLREDLLVEGSNSRRGLREEQRWGAV